MPYEKCKEYNVSSSALNKWVKLYSELKTENGDKGHPYDNAVTECFFKYAKKEELDRRSFSSLQDVKLAAFEYIEGYYNSVRLHSYNNNETPVQKEK